MIKPIRSFAFSVFSSAEAETPSITGAPSLIFASKYQRATTDPIDLLYGGSHERSANGDR